MADDPTRPWTVGADEGPGSTSQLQTAVVEARQDAPPSPVVPSPPQPAGKPKRAASAKTPPARPVDPEGAADPPPIAQLVDDEPAVDGDAEPPSVGNSETAVDPQPPSPPRGVSPSFVHGRAVELRTTARLIRSDLEDLRDSVASTFATGLSELAQTVQDRVLSLRVVFPPASKKAARAAVTSMRQSTECLRTAVNASAQTLNNDMARLQQDLTRIAKNQPEPAIAERAAIRRLHGAIDDLIREGGVGTELDRTHHDARMQKIKEARDAREKIAARPSTRICSDTRAPPTGSPRDDSPSAGVDDLAMPPPSDVLPAMYGTRSWKLHSPSLLEAIPYAVNALEALKNATHKNSKARDLLQLRISRQERQIDDLNARNAAMENVLAEHVASLEAVLARVANGRVIRHHVPNADDPKVTEQLRAVSSTVEQFIEHLAYVAERHAKAAARGATVDVPSSTMGLVPSTPHTARPTAAEAARARLFPDTEKVGRLHGQIALLRRKTVQLRFRLAMQTWRYRRCALALVQRHDRLSAQEATEAQNAAFDEAVAEMGSHMQSTRKGAADPTGTGGEEEPRAPMVADESAQQLMTPDPAVAASGQDAPRAASAADTGGNATPTPAHALATSTVDPTLQPEYPPHPPPRFLAADEASVRLERAGILPRPGTDALMEAAEVKAQDDSFRFERRAEAAQESWRARRAKEALERFRASQSGGVAPEPTKTLLELDGGHTEKPTVFSALPPAPTSPRFQKATQVSATKARLRPISDPHAHNYSASRVPPSAPRPGHGRSNPRGATAPVPPAPTSYASPRQPRAAGTGASLGAVPIADALGAFLAEAQSRPHTQHYASRPGLRLS